MNDSNTKKDNSEVKTQYGYDDEDDFGADYGDNAAEAEHDETEDYDGVYKKDKISSKLSNAKKPAVIAFACAAALFLAVYIFCAATLPTDKVARNVYVEDLSLGGLSYDAALESIKATYLFENKEITLKHGDEMFSVTGANINLSAMPEETAQKAFQYGKTGNTVRDAFTSMGLLLKKHVIVPVPQADTDKLDAKIGEFGVRVYGELVQHSIDIEPDRAIVIPGHTGYNNDPSAAREEILDAMKKEQFTDIEITLESAPPDELTLQEFDNAVYKDPVNARFEIENNEVRIIPEEQGRFINKDEAAALLANVRDGGEPVEIPVYIMQPEKNSGELSEKLFCDTMSSYSTSYGGSTANRASNVARASELINGTVIAPGEVFSFNDTVGERTVENGFSTAKEYVDGKSVDGIGGGTCQVSSTLYSAVLYASLEIVTRTNHMFTVSYIPNGQDATVSDGGVDFKFRNNTEYPIKIKSSAGGGTITVTLIGTKPNPSQSVKIINQSSTNTSGVTSTTTTRYTYDAEGNLIDTHTLPSSRYNPYTG